MTEPIRSAGLLRWKVTGVPVGVFQDIYPRLMGASWTVTIAWAFAAYVGACFAFACLYAVESGGVRGAETYTDLLWFSVQTLSTIGYGGMVPVTPWANLLVVVESFFGLAGVAVVTAILYAKFSLPAARVRFSDRIAIHDRRGVPTLHLRMLNERNTPILDVNLHVGVLLEDNDGEERFRRLFDLKLVRDRVPVFAMAFTAMHTLDDDSALHAIQADPGRMLFLIVTLRGVDDRTLQPVFARAMYSHDQLAFGSGFGQMVQPGGGGVIEVDARRLHDMEPRTLSPLRRGDES
ncbi:MAG: inward rectifier potassium channel [Myxococcota bacterium]|jgi:inward rectifier potassium channel